MFFSLILDAIIYIDVNGCQWRMLPTKYPQRQIVYYYFRRWGAMDSFSELEDGLVEKVRLKRGESSHPTIGAIDSQRTRTAMSWRPLQPLPIFTIPNPHTPLWLCSLSLSHG